MPPRFSRQQINGYTLAKQHLTPATRVAKVSALVRTLGPIRATPTTLPYMSIWARVREFQRSDLDEALYKERALVRMPCLHAQLYLVAQQDVAAYYWATRPLVGNALADLEDLMLATGDGCPSAVSYGELTRRVLEIISSRGPMTIQELALLLPDLQQRIMVAPGQPELGHSLLGTRLLPALCAEGLLIRANPQGGWKSSQYRYASMASWLPETALDEEISPQDALRRVVADYVRVYGPVSISDIGHWLGGYRRREIAAAVRTLSDQLVRIEIDDLPGEFHLLRDQADDLAAIEPQESVCLLPSRDSYSMAYSDRERFLSGYRRDRIYGSFGDSVGTIWLNGAIVGTWGVRLREQHIDVQFFEPADPYNMALVGERARELAEMLDFASFELEMGTDQDQDPDAADEDNLPLVPVACPESGG